MKVLGELNCGKLKPILKNLVNPLYVLLCAFFVWFRGRKYQRSRSNRSAFW